jgi:hypothetical protein
MALPFRMKIKTAPQLSPWNRKLLSFLNAMSHERPALQHEQSFREMRDLAASAQTDAAKKLELQIGNYCLDWLGAETSIRIALNAGAAFQPGFTGHWGLAVLTSPNFGSAIRVAAKYFAMSPYNQVPTITIGEDVATLVGRDSRQLGRARDVITAFDIASGWRFLTILIGGKLPTREIEIPLPQSPSANELKKIFGVVPKFSRASQSRFVFDASCMRVPLMLADAELSAAHAEACALVADRTPNGSPVAQAVRDYLVRYQHSNPRARDVSRALATSERTLRPATSPRAPIFQKVRSRCSIFTDLQWVVAVCILGNAAFPRCFTYSAGVYRVTESSHRMQQPRQNYRHTWRLSIRKIGFVSRR